MSEKLRKKLFEGTYYNNNVESPVKGKIKNVLIFDDGEVAIFYEGGSVKSNLENIKPIRRPSNVIAKFEWCYILKNDKDEVIGYIGKTEDNALQEMTIDEAIEQLEDLRKDRESFLTEDSDEVYKKDIQAIDVAIKALEFRKQLEGGIEK